MNRSLKTLACAFACGLSSLSYAYILTGSVSVQPERALFVSIQNASSVPLYVSLSSGTGFRINKNEGKLIACSAISGVTMFVDNNVQSNPISSPLDCGHVYTIEGDK